MNLTKGCTYRSLFTLLLCSFFIQSYTQDYQAQLDSADHYFGLEQLIEAAEIYTSITKNTNADINDRFRANIGLLRVANFNSNLEQSDSLIVVGNQLITKHPDISKVVVLNFQQKEAEFLRAKSKFNDALLLHLKVLQESKLESDTALTAYGYLYTSTTHEKLSNHQTAVIYGDSALVVFNSILSENDRRWGSIYNTLASNYQRVNDFDKSELYYKKSIDVIKSTVGNNSAMLAMVYNNLSGIYSNRGEFDKAIDITKKAIQINQTIGEEDGLGYNYYALGVYYYYLGDWGRCKDYMEACIDVRQKIYGEGHYRLANPYEVLGIAYETFENYELNIHYLKKALEIKKNTFGDDHIQIAFSYENIAIGYLKSEHLDSATHYIVLSNNMLKDKLASNDLDLSTHLHTLATINLENNRTVPALKAIQQSIGIHKVLKLENTPDYALNKSLEASVYLKMRDHQSAHQSFRQALKILKVDSGTDQQFKVSENTLSVLDTYIDFLHQEYIRTNNEALKDSIRTYAAHSQRVINDFKKQSNDPYTKIAVARYAASTNHQNISIIYNFLKQQPTNLLKDELFNLVEQNRTTLFRDLIDDYKIKEFANISAESLDIEDSLKNLISIIHEEIYNNGSSDSLKGQLFEVKEMFNTHIESYNANYPSYYQLKYKNDPVSTQQIQDKLLNDGASLIEYFEDDTAYYAFLITKELSKTYFVSNKSNLDQLIQSWRNSIVTIDFKQSKQIGSELSGVLWKPIQQHLTDKIIVIPSGSLYYLSFEALPSVNTESEYLIHSHSFSYGLSADVLSHQNDQKSEIASKSFIIAPGFESSLKDEYQSELPDDETVDDRFLKTIRQPWSINLAKNIAKQKQVTPLTSTEATETYIKQNLKEGNIFHFATHAIAEEEDPLRSKLVLAKDIGEQLNDGYLHAYELYNFPLKAELAILSACESGIGNIQDGEGMISLAYSMNYAGCPSVAMSLWKIDEKSNAVILNSFYKNLNKSRTKSEALRQAKLNYLQMNKGELSHPFYWSGMIIMGNDQPIAIQSKWWPKYRSWILLFSFFLVVLIFLKRNVS